MRYVSPPTSSREFCNKSHLAADINQTPINTTVFNKMQVSHTYESTWRMYENSHTAWATMFCHVRCVSRILISAGSDARMITTIANSAAAQSWVVDTCRGPLIKDHTAANTATTSDSTKPSESHPCPANARINPTRTVSNVRLSWRVLCPEVSHTRKVATGTDIKRS